MWRDRDTYREDDVKTQENTICKPKEAQTHRQSYGVDFPHSPQKEPSLGHFELGLSSSRTARQ